MGFFSKILLDTKKNPTMSRAILYLWLYIYQVIKSNLLIP